MFIQQASHLVPCILNQPATLPTHASPTCPLEGPVFPKPARLSQSAVLQSALANLTSTFRDITSRAQNYSFALEVFSAHDPQPLFSVLHTAPKLSSNATGVSKVDENAVFRVGSLTKIYTVYLLLISVGDKIWNEGIVKYVPELQKLAGSGNGNESMVEGIAWDQVTIGGLATQMTGIPRDYALLGELTQTPATRDHAVEYGLPPLSAQERPPCGDFPVCNRTRNPSLAPFTTAAYSNVAFQLLGYALETITGKKFEALLTDAVLKPLGLNSTFLHAPDRSRGVIQGNPDAVGWTFDLGEAAPAGNIYTSIHDLSELGRSILSYRLLDPVTTRRWLKPFSFSTDPRAAVGAPWGARRINVVKGQPYRWTTAFNKAGRISDYSSVLAILPDYDIGISVLLAGELPGNANFNLLDIIGETLLPAIESAAREEAGAGYSGHYAYADTAKNLNSSLTIVTDDQPGLGVTQWISNGTDFLTMSTVLQNGYFPLNPRIRLYPTGLESSGGGSRKTRSVGFKATFEDADAASKAEAMFSTDCATWINVGSVTYGNFALDEFVFNFDDDGSGSGSSSSSVTLPALRITLDRK
ncbi:beta-lactamase/transpeptidase-like protein [Xylariaceae sp. FL0594]|nr:beta-lactamase/transpeptidase-like protein [Xylariaceae sp. FL0594]